MAPITKGKYKDPVRYDQIVKSPNDKRNYRGLVLQNKLKVLLISDPTTDKSAASLDVNVYVGYASDPKEFPGLAHFCQRMLYYGTSKYPEINNYNNYISQYGGYSNAATYLDHTNYYFDVNPEKLEGALDRFSQFFIAPVFPESAIDMEMNAMEHEKYTADYTRRLDQLNRFSADPNYTYIQYGTEGQGSQDVTPKQIRNELLNFYKKYYSANVMTLSVLGKENLDELEKMVVEMFSPVENKELKAPRWDEQHYKEEYFGTKYYVVPNKDVRYLNLTFPVPDLKEHYHAAPAYYWVYLMRHQGKGSLYSALKEKGYTNYVTAEKRSSGKGFDYFNVHIDLTEGGVNHVNDIITMYYQYINMLKKEGPMNYIYEEYRDNANTNFRYQEKYYPRDYVQSTVRYLQEYPIEEVLSAPYFYTEWRPEMIKDFAQYLVPEKMRVHVVAKYYESLANSVEPYYSTKYKMEKISDEEIKQYNNAGYYQSFYYPERNEFAPNNFDIKAVEQVEKYPTIIQDTPYVRVWYKQDDEYRVPKASMYFDFVSPVAYFDPISFNMTYMFVELFRDSVEEYAYYAKLAGLNYELSYSKYGFRMSLTGYNHKMDVFLEKIFNRMVNFKVNEKRFEILKENYIRWLNNFEAEHPYEHSRYYLEVLLSEQVWDTKELLAATNAVTAERVQQFIPMFMSKVHVEYLIHGNVTKSEAFTYAKQLENKITAFKYSTPLLPEQMLLHRVYELPYGQHYLYETEYKHTHKCSSTQIYYQNGLQSTESNALLELFAQIIYEPFYYTMRIKEQIAYRTYSGIYRKNGVQGLRVVVQSGRQPEYVEKRIDEFMNSIQEYIKAMPDEEFNRHKESVATRRQEKPKTLSTQSEYYWREITNQQYNYDRANIEAAYLRTITRDQIIKYYQDVYHTESRYQKLSVYVVSSREGGVRSAQRTGQYETTSGTQKINDVLQFKSGHSLYPLVEPYNNVPRKGTAARQYKNY